MRILQTHVDWIEYEPLEKEIKSAEEVEKKKHRMENTLVLFVSAERGDNEDLVKQSVDEVKDFLGKLKCNKLLIYPFAHLSSDLAKPADALDVLKLMESHAKKLDIDTYRAPFGWNKKMSLSIKGHPLAEQSRHYSLREEVKKELSKPAKKEREQLSEHAMMSRIQRSDFTGLPETDHRIIGEKLDLFSFQEPSPGMVYWHDKGIKIRNILMDFIRSELAKRNYIEVSTPALANTVLWRVSGHWDHYQDNMFLTNLGEDEFGLKPMNCPSTFMIFKSKKWSYKELPLRVADFDQLFRNELSGVASGLFRVKILTQDDAHIFVTEDQIESEIKEQIDLMVKMYGIFNLNYKLKISTMPDDHMGTEEQWNNATDILKKVVKEKGIKPEIKEKEGAFYGPKIDVDIKDSMGRDWQCATIQLDFQMPKRFKLIYIGPDGKEHTPTVIHRVIYGSLERFIGIITEHYQGKFPLWLSPVQVRVISISDENRNYAEGVLKSLREHGIRAEADLDSKTLEYKIRDAQMQKLPFMVIVGGKEEIAKTIAVRSREGKVEYNIKLNDFVERIKEDSKNFK